MPRIFKIGSYSVYFWANEGMPLEPIHVHISPNQPTANATKVWITSDGKCLLCNNSSQIPSHILSDIMRVIEARHKDVEKRWKDFHGEITYYC